MIYYLMSTFLTIGAFIFGVNIGLKLKKGNEIKLEVPNIPKIIKEKKIEKEKDKEIEKLNIVLQNIENYDGTSQYQKAVK